MRVRSWMAALALIGTSSILIGRGFSAQGSGRAQDASPSKTVKASQAEKRPTEPARAHSKNEQGRGSDAKLPTIQLNLRIAGLGTRGCDVEVKPANAGCKFRPSPSKHVDSNGHATIELNDIELRGADKTCTMAITIREPGQPPQTIYRGFRTASTRAGSVPRFDCYISSRLASVETKATRK